MRILFVSNDIDGLPSSFVESQGKSLQELGVEVEFFLVSRKGVWGYLYTFVFLKQKINKFQPHIIHAHYGLCGILANLQRKIPVVTTYHGSDINNYKVRQLSKISIYLSKYNIFVSRKQIEFIKPKKKFVLQPCGIYTQIFIPIDQQEARRAMNLPLDIKIILFSNFFSTTVKNAPLAIEAVSKIAHAQLIELRGYTPPQVCLLMNAADACLMTSFTEGAPLFIKEALACNRPIVSTDVGDVKELLTDIEGCSICSYEIDDVVAKLNAAFTFKQLTKGREKVLQYDEVKVADNIRKIYMNVLEKKSNN